MVQWSAQLNALHQFLRKDLPNQAPLPGHGHSTSITVLAIALYHICMVYQYFLLVLLHCKDPDKKTIFPTLTNKCWDCIY